MPVRSRVSWGAIFAGAAMAFTVYFILSLLGTAIGLSVRDRVEGENLGIGAVTWAGVSLILALFVGGYVASQCAVGENKAEATIHGIMVWGVLFIAIVWLATSTVRSGFSALVNVAHTGTGATDRLTREGWEEAARRAGVPTEQIDRMRGELNRNGNADGAAGQAPTTEQAAQYATQAAWWSVVGVLMSMLAAVCGALAGSGPTPHLIAIMNRTRVVTSQQSTARTP